MKTKFDPTIKFLYYFDYGFGRVQKIKVIGEGNSTYAGEPVYLCEYRTKLTKGVLKGGFTLSDKTIVTTYTDALNNAFNYFFRELQKSERALKKQQKISDHLRLKITKLNYSESLTNKNFVV